MDKKPLIMVAVATFCAIGLVLSITMIARAVIIGAASVFGLGG
jgi:hypothetical protein